MKIAVAAELAPAKTLIPVLERLDGEFIGLSHGNGAKTILSPYCSEIHSIGQGRGAGIQKRSNAKIGYLILKDTLKAARALKGKNIELLITCGNAGDVRKGLFAANLLRIPTLHIEQDIYNPIEMISFANVVTAPSNKYKCYLEDHYGLIGVKNIEGYPMASYVDKLPLIDEDEIKNKYNVDDFILVALGGDLKAEQIPELLKTIELLDRPILIAPFRFDREYIQNLIFSSPSSNNSQINVLDGFVDLPSLMNASEALIYGAGMGITIEAAVLKVPSIKIAGFHHKHASVDLAEKVGIKVAKIENIPFEINGLAVPDGHKLIKNAEKSICKLTDLVNNFDELNQFKGGLVSLNSIWKARSQFR